MDLLQDLNSEQKKAVTHPQGPLLIVAGAGTGKTTVITQRLAWLIKESKAKSDEILALTFTDKAAGEMEERVDRLLPYGYVDLWVSTFHAFGERILKDHALKIGISHDFKLLDTTEQWLLVRQNLDRFKLDYYRPLGNPTKFIHALIKHFSRAKDEEIWPRDYLKYTEGLRLDSDNLEFIKNSQNLTKHKELLGQEIARLNEIAEAYHTYEQLLLENNALDFGDLINFTLKLFRKRSLILDEYRRKFKYILVDEFQDTNWAQYELVKILTAPKNNLTVTGDDDQSVYKFRGASISNILQFKRDFPQSQEVILIKNYRNRQNILDLSYNFIQLNNPYRLEYQLTSQPGQDKAKRGLKSRVSKKLVAASTGLGIIEHLKAKTFNEEARMVVEKILELRSKRRDYTWNDFAILVRANETAEKFVQVLSSYNLPHQFLASRGLYTKPIILDILAYLKLLDDYHEGPALYRILNLPFFNLPQHQIIKLTHLANKKSWSLYETIRQARKSRDLEEKTLKLIDKILNLIDRHSAEAREKSVGKIILAFLEDFGYLKYLSEKRDEQVTRETLGWLNQFYKEIAEFEETSSQKTVRAFTEALEYILASGEKGALTPSFEEEGPEAVKVMTIHAAKGLEFRFVFVVSMVDKRFPTIERKEAIELPDKLVKEIIPEGDIHLQEERRLFYVAMTRAKEGLFFTSALDYGGSRKKKPSRFLFEVGLAKEEAKELLKGFADLAPEKPSISAPSINIEALPRRFSFTQLRAFENCPLQYKFAHILRIPVRGKATFSFGKTVHNTLLRFFQVAKERTMSQQADLFGQKTASQKIKDLMSAEELLKIYEAAWIEDWYESRAQQKEYKARGRSALEEFYEALSDEQNLPKYLERGFNMKIGDYTLKGVIDRVDELSPGRIEIIDYKTGAAQELKKLSLREKEQLLIYQMAVEQVFEEKPVALSYYYIEDNKKISFLGEEKELQELKDKIIKEIREIVLSDFPPKPSHLCRTCDFRQICEFRM